MKVIHIFEVVSLIAMPIKAIAKNMIMLACCLMAPLLVAEPLHDGAATLFAVIVLLSELRESVNAWPNSVADPV